MRLGQLEKSTSGAAHHARIQAFAPRAEVYCARMPRTPEKPPLETPSIDVAAIQLAQHFGHPTAILDELSRVLASDALRGVDLALLPEAILTGYVSETGDFDLRRFAEPLDGPTTAALSRLARCHGMTLAGPLVESCNGLHYNSLVLFDPAGSLVAHYRKRHPWFPEEWANPGDLDNPIIELLGLRITAAICFDIHFVTEDAGPTLDAADVLLFPTAWVDVPEEGDLRAQLLPGLARRHGISIVNANWGISRPWLFGQGGSRVLDARGEVVSKAEQGRGTKVVRARIGPGR